MKINSIIDLVKDLDTSRQTKNLNKLLIRILLHLQVEFSFFNAMNMKKNVLLMPVCVWALAFMPATAHSQGFLKKLKQKVENAVVETDASEENTDEAATEGEAVNGTPTPADKIPKLRMAVSSWDEMIQPSKASTVRALLDELPALPSVAAMVAPTEEGRASYYRKIVAVDMRVEELDEQRTCPDEEMLAAREKLYQEMIDITGLTIEEMKRLEDPNLPEAEKEQLAEKARNAMISGSEMGCSDCSAGVDL